MDFEEENQEWTLMQAAKSMEINQLENLLWRDVAGGLVPAQLLAPQAGSASPRLVRGPQRHGPGNNSLPSAWKGLLSSSVKGKLKEENQTQYKC